LGRCHSCKDKKDGALVAGALLEKAPDETDIAMMSFK
jgi:hypothetical protein